MADGAGEAARSLGSTAAGLRSGKMATLPRGRPREGLERPQGSCLWVLRHAQPT